MIGNPSGEPPVIMLSAGTEDFHFFKGFRIVWQGNYKREVRKSPCTTTTGPTARPTAGPNLYLDGLGPVPLVMATVQEFTRNLQNGGLSIQICLERGKTRSLRSAGPCIGITEAVVRGLLGN